MSYEERIKKYRETHTREDGKPVTQADFAKMVGCSLTMVRNYEMGVAKPEKYKERIYQILGK